ncbi:hypothetical protein QQS21_006262 [Conoideocrella luteorostrata]|uniref:AtmA protein n=1 Tax=Conoideocrella luteorostrata TaxID=1105319 RepID=A0AAJ0G0A9_9HYPO|nr:hypothetical protein QQS21_006262 [Conoideocrella luteorostrata]
MSAKLILPTLSLSVFYFIWYFSYINGLKTLGDATVLAKKLPGLNEPLRLEYTGVEPVDWMLVQLTTFFWPLADGSQPGLLLHSIAFSGTFCSAWILVTLESWRKGNARTVAAFPAFLGIVAQLLTFAFAAPLYGYLHLTRAATASKPNSKNMRIPHGVIKAIPHVFTVGMLVPSMLMIAPLSEIVTYDLKQILVAIWQPWPAYVAILLVLAHYTVGGFFSDVDTPANNRKIRSSLRYVYAFAFANTAISHIITWSVSLATAVVPGIFQEKYADVLHPRRVFETFLPWTSPALKVATVGQGVQVFLRWDYLIGSAGVLIWSISLYRSAHRAANVKVGLLELATKVIALSALSSPVGAAVELMWEREELFLQDVEKPAKAGSSKK